MNPPGGATERRGAGHGDHGGGGSAGDADVSEIPVEGVTAIDHTADVGLDVEAADLPELLARAALGMDWLLREGRPPAEEEERSLELDGGDPPFLLRALLRELLTWFELDGFAPATVDVHEASPTRLRARLRGGIPDSPPVREIKGVTLHALAAEPRDGRWWGRVIFDV